MSAKSSQDSIPVHVFIAELNEFSRSLSWNIHVQMSTPSDT